MKSKKRCIVTGAGGFIGMHLSLKLLEKGYTVLCIDNFNNYYSKKLKLDRRIFLEHQLKSLPKEEIDYNFLEIDLRNYDSINKSIEKFAPDVICHLAGQPGVRYSVENPYSYVDNNITATLNLLEASRKNHTKDFVFASTGSVYGLNSSLPFKEDLPINTTISPYSSTKHSCELLFHTYNNLYGINTKVLRFFTVYGPWGRPDMSFSLFTKAILNDEPIKIFNNGLMKRDFTYIDDIISGILKAIDKELEYEVINLGSGKMTSLMDYIEILETKLDKKAIKDYREIQMGDIKNTWADITKAKKLLDYSPSYSIEEGISKFVDWYLEYNK